MSYQENELNESYNEKSFDSFLEQDLKNSILHESFKNDSGISLECVVENKISEKIEIPNFDPIDRKMKIMSNFFLIRFVWLDLNYDKIKIYTCSPLRTQLSLHLIMNQS